MSISKFIQGAAALFSMIKCVLALAPILEFSWCDLALYNGLGSDGLWLILILRNTNVYLNRMAT